MEDETTSEGGEERYARRDPGGLSGGRIPAPPIPRDEWVAQVVDDPGSGAQPVLLQGYVGDAPDKDGTRIYLDASLSRFVDVRNEDVLHHQPLEGDHTPRGGSMVWVRGDAFVSQGAGNASFAAAGGFFTGPVLEQNRQPGLGGAAQPGGPFQITLLTVAGCPLPTQRPQCTWICPIQTRHAVLCSWVCRDPIGGIGPVTGTLTGITGEPPEPPPSVVDYCPTKPAPCNNFTDFMHETVNPRPFAAAAPHGGPVVNTFYLGCRTLGFACTYVSCAQAGVGAEAVAGPQAGAVNTFHVGCRTLGFTCTYVNCPPVGGGEAPGTFVSLPGCVQPTRLLGCTGYLGCGQPPQISVPGCMPSAVDACPTRPCPGGGFDVDTGFAGAAPQAAALPTGVYGPQCHTFGFTCTYVNCPPVQQAPVTAGLGCPRTSTCPPTADPGCPRTSTCPPTYTPGCGGTGEAAAIPTGQYAPQCPTFGFTCTYVNCPPQTAITVFPGCPPPTGPNGTVATVCTQLGCPRTSTCPPTYTPGCGGTGEAFAAANAQPHTVHPRTCPTFGFSCTQIPACPP